MSITDVECTARLKFAVGCSRRGASMTGVACGCASRWKCDSAEAWVSSADGIGWDSKPTTVRRLTGPV